MKAGLSRGKSDLEAVCGIPKDNGMMELVEGNAYQSSQY